MRDKLSNILIVLMVIIVIALGSMYYFKVVANPDYSLEKEITLGEEYENDNNSITANANTVEENTEGNRVSIKSNVENNASSIYVNTNQIGYKYNNKYYYNGLDTYSKAIYDSILRELDNLKTGTHQIEIDYDFRVLLNSVNGQAELKNYYDDAVNALNLDVPNLFYINFDKMFLTIQEKTSMFSTTYRLYIDSGKYPNYFADNFSSQEQVEKALRQIDIIKKQVKANLQGSDYNKLKDLHDWIIEYMEYNLESTQRGTIYGALIEKKGVCEAYARTYKTILDELGIGNVLITGTGTNSNGETEAHMWNYVQLNDNWYAVDVTWDDPIIIGGGTVGQDVRYRYFLLRK